MQTKISHTLRWFLLITAVLLTASTLHAQEDDSDLPPPDTVTIAGDFQDQFDCGEWNTSCEATYLTYDAEDDLWLATFELEAGAYEYKAALNDTWDDNYGLNAEYYGPNIPLEVEEAGPVTFWYDHKTRWVSDDANSILATVPGDFQDEIGCSGDWAPDCLRSLLQDPDGDGLYTFTTAAIPPGDYEAKVAFNQSWDVNYGAEGEADGPNIPFSVGEDEATIFSFDPATNLLTISSGEPGAAPAASAGSGTMPEPAAPMPDLVVVPGTLQDEAGCDGEWQPDCEATALTFDEEDQLWTNTFTLPAGEYEYKVALNGSWDVNFGLNVEPDGPNIPLALEEETAVTFYFDHATGWIADDVNNTIANVPGDFQDEIGCPGEWAPDCLRSWLQDPDGDGVFTFLTDAIPAGEYEAKVAVGRSWAENYGEGGAQDGPNIPFSVAEDGALVAFTWDSGNKMLTIQVGGGAAPAGNIREAKAHWVTADTIAWDIEANPDYSYQFHYSPTGGGLSLSAGAIEGGEALDLTLNEEGLPPAVTEKFPHLAGYTTFTIAEEDLGRVRIALKGQVAISATDAGGAMVDATGLQIPGVLDDLYTYDGPLGVTYEAGVPTLRVWAPTAQSVKLVLFADANPETRGETFPMRVDPDTGVWSITGDAEWNGHYYLYEVTVYAPSTGAVETNRVTDPYAFSLSRNSRRSQIVDLADPDLQPEGWEAHTPPPLDAPEDIVLYELHVRDFSAYDDTVPEEHRGKFLAFTHPDSAGMSHLQTLAAAGVTHLHLLPSFDIATINENEAEWIEPDPAKLAEYPPDSEEPQAIINEIRDQDGYNWGYDPFHYTVPEGSYATDPDGPARIVEFRRMVQSLHEQGLRVVLDVVYNHTNASGQADKSVLDRIAPGYYHRLTGSGRVQTSTCCQNTATEHNMMRKLMVDSILTWATAYRVDGFRFDLMGHHMKADMLEVREALDGLTLEENGVNGSAIYVYGEGWDFGEVAGNQRGVNATQLNMPGTGIGTFNDRLRDAVRGGNPFGGQREQGFINGLYYDPNETDQGSESEQLERLLLFADQIRVGLAGNLADYEFTNAAGETVTGADIDYNRSPVGYTQDPQEHIIYVSAHDNETLFDAIQYKAPLEATTAERARMQNMGLSIVSLSQGAPFFHAGSDLLRSKSMDRNSYNSGDWFNAIDWDPEADNWGIGLPPAADNEEMWPVIGELLANPDLEPAAADVESTAVHAQEMWRIRRSSPLFRLQTAEAIQERVAFHNTGPEQIPGAIVMSLSDMTGEDLDPMHDLIVVLFNANDEALSFGEETLAGLPLTLHPIQADSADPVVGESAFDAETGTFTVPGRTTAVFVLGQGEGAAATEEEATAEDMETEQESAAEADVDEAEMAAEDEHGDEAVEEAETASGSATEALSIFAAALAAGALIGLLAALGARRSRKRQKEGEHEH